MSLRQGTQLRDEKHRWVERGIDRESLRQNLREGWRKEGMMGEATAAAAAAAAAMGRRRSRIGDGGVVPTSKRKISASKRIAEQNGRLRLKVMDGWI